MWQGMVTALYVSKQYEHDFVLVVSRVEIG